MVRLAAFVSSQGGSTRIPRLTCSSTPLRSAACYLRRCPLDKVHPACCRASTGAGAAPPGASVVAGYIARRFFCAIIDGCGQVKAGTLARYDRSRVLQLGLLSHTIELEERVLRLQNVVCWNSRREFGPGIGVAIRTGVSAAGGTARVAL